MAFATEDERDEAFASTASTNVGFTRNASAALSAVERDIRNDRSRFAAFLATKDKELDMIGEPQPNSDELLDMVRSVLLSE